MRYVHALITLSLLLAGFALNTVNGQTEPAKNPASKDFRLVPTASPSLFVDRINDPKAVYLDAAEFGAKGDGVADDTAAIQAAVNKVKTGIQRGILFVPEGRYKISKPVYVWAGIRLIGVGKNRPTFVLADNTPGYQGDGTAGGGGPKYMFMFVSDPPRPHLDPEPPKGERYTGRLGDPQMGGGPLEVPDGNPGCFYSAMNNCNIEIGAGNPAAVGARFHVAQHCFLSNMDFYIGSGRAGIDGVGNESENLRFYGGEYGIITGSTSPSWPYVLIDSKFEGQRQGAIKTFLCGMTVVNCEFKNVPVAVEIFENQWESLFMKDCVLTGISKSALVISDDKKVGTRVNVENVTQVATTLPAKPQEMQFVTFRPESLGKPIGGTPSMDGMFNVKEFSYGQRITAVGAPAESKTSFASFPQEQPWVSTPQCPTLPPTSAWVDVTTLGLKGDNATDNTAALKAAIEKYKVLYFPIGRYKVTDTITLKPDTVLIAMHPMATQLILKDETPAFNYDPKANADAATFHETKALLETPKGGTNIVYGLGLDAGINNLASGCKWQAGEKSYMNDVKFIGGHGVFTPEGNRVATYNGDRAKNIPATGDFDPKKIWDSKPASLWITNGGGGTFKDVWSADPMAQAGIMISDTSTPGRLYEVSIEHHCTVELLLKNVQNWGIYGQQQEEERVEGAKAIALDAENCSNITFGNLWFFRMASTEGPFASRWKNCTNIQIKGTRAYAAGSRPGDPNPPQQFKNTFYDATAEKYTDAPFIGWLTIGGK